MSVSQRNSPRRGSLMEPRQSVTSSTDKRSKLHNSSTIHWLRRRHQNTANLQYLYLPEEIQTHLEVQNVFNLIDEDKSGKLALHEFYNMLRQAKIKIGMNDLKEFYQSVDDDRDVALDFREFKNCTLSEEANLHFAKMMENVRKAHEDSFSKKRNSLRKKSILKQKIEDPKSNNKDETEEAEPEKPFLPRTFGTLLNYLAYLTKKKEMHDFINSKHSDSVQKYKKFEQLIDLQMDKDIYLEHYNTKLQKPQNPLNSGRLTTRSQPEVLELGRSNSQEGQIEFNKGFMTSSTFKFSKKEDLNPSQNQNFIKGIEEMAEKTRQMARIEFHHKQRKPLKPIVLTHRSPSPETEQISAQKHSARNSALNSHRNPIKSRGFFTATNSPQKSRNELEDENIKAGITSRKIFNGLLSQRLGSYSRLTPSNENNEKNNNNKFFNIQDYGLNEGTPRATKNTFELRNKLDSSSKPASPEGGLPTENNIYPQTARVGDTKPFQLQQDSSLPSRLISQPLQSYRETPSSYRSDYIASEMASQAQVPVTKSSKMPFTYESVTPTFSYYCNSTSTTAGSRQRSKKRAVFVGLNINTPTTMKIQPESARVQPNYGPGGIGLKLEEIPALSKINSQGKTILDPRMSFQENLALKLQLEMDKGDRKKKKIQLKGKRMQPLSLDSSIRKK